MRIPKLPEIRRLSNIASSSAERSGGGRSFTPKSRRSRRTIDLAPRDEFNLDLRVSYAGAPLELPDRRPSNEEIMASADGQRKLAGFMLRRHADRVHAAHRDGRLTILFHFDH